MKPVSFVLAAFTSEPHVIIHAPLRRQRTL